MSRHTAVLAAALVALVAAPAVAQESETAKPARAQKAEPKPDSKPEATPEPEGARPVRGVTATLRVQLVLSRFQGEKKTGSLPYSFVVTAGAGNSRMRMGVDTPVPTTSVVTTAQGESKPSTSYQYRNVGTNIDCFARDLGEGRYQLNLTVENSAAIAGPAAHDSASGAPLFRRFETSLNPVLRDGQSIQTIASTDPVTGEVVKIDVTLNVVK